MAAFFALGPYKNWQPVSWQQFAQKAGWVGAALNEAGIGKGDRVGILAPTSLNWEYAQMGSFIAGAAVAGIDPGYPADQLDQVINLLDPSALFVQDLATLARIPQDVRGRIKLIVVFDGNSNDALERSIQDILAANRGSELRNTFAGPEPGDAAAIVFSSGTTGPPKAIVFSHEQVCAAIDSILAAFDDIEEGVVLLCWLPLANLFQRVINFFAIARGATSYMLSDPRELMNHLGSVQPHILIGVPRVFERMQAGITEHIEKRPRPIRHLIRWAMREGHERAFAKISGKRRGIAATISWQFADKLALRRLRGVFGGRLRYFVSGSAPMPLWLLEWFEGIGLPVLEAYGVSENIIPIATNRFSSRKPGTVGRPLSPNEVRLAPDGEILVRGPGVFNGYWNVPASAPERFTAEGYWCTGDFGRLDEEGFLSLLGRKSEAFKTSGGKWISPMRVEEQLRRVSYIMHSTVFQLDSGEIASILSIDKSKLMRAAIGKAHANEGPINEDFQRIFEETLRTDLSAALSVLPPYQRPVGVIATCNQFSIEGGELTVNLKLRHRIIIERFSSHLQRLETGVAETLKNRRPTGTRSDLRLVIIIA
jgi:long-chain acyl-CoA synthetase